MRAGRCRPGPAAGSRRDEATVTPAVGDEVLEVVALAELQSVGMVADDDLRLVADLLCRVITELGQDGEHLGDGIQVVIGRRDACVRVHRRVRCACRGLVRSLFGLRAAGRAGGCVVLVRA